MILNAKRSRHMLLDPTRTTSLVRRFVSRINGHANVLQQAIWQLVVVEDAFGLNARKPFEPLGTNERWAFATDKDKIAGYQSWFQEQVDSGLLRVDAAGKPWTAEFTESAYKAGTTRSYVDSLAAQGKLAGGKFYEGGKAAFLNDAFNAPVAVRRIETLSTRAFTSLKGITQQMSTDMSRTLADGFAAGRGTKQIARDLRKNVQGLTARRAKVIARTEIVHAYAEGQLDSFERIGVDKLGVLAEWSTAGDDRVCPQCQPLEGVMMTVKEARGLIPRHPNCRCAWIPAVPGRRPQPGQKFGTEANQRALDASVKAERKKPRKLDKARDVSSWRGADVRVGTKVNEFRPAQPLKSRIKPKPSRRVLPKKGTLKRPTPKPGATGARAEGLFNHQPTAVVRWMGKEGWTLDEARLALKNSGVTIADSTLKIQLKAGAKGLRGTPAAVTDAEALVLRSRRTIGVDPPPPKPPAPKPPEPEAFGDLAKRTGNDHAYLDDGIADDTWQRLNEERLQNANELRRRGYNLPDYDGEYELRLVNVDDITPSQFGEDYINSSSEYLSKHLDTYLSSGRREDYLAILLDEKGMILDGNHRHAAHVLAGKKKIPVLIPKGAKKLPKGPKPKLPPKPKPPKPPADLIGDGDAFIDESKFFKSGQRDLPSGTSAQTKLLEEGGGYSREVDISDLIPTQEYTGADKVKSLAKEFDPKKGIVQVVEVDGKLYIYDGHHTAAAARYSGRTKIKVRIAEGKVKLPKPPAPKPPAPKPPPKVEVVTPDFSSKPKTGLVRWLAKEDFSFQDAKRALQEAGIDIADATIRAQLRRPGVLPTLTDEQAAFLRSFKGKASKVTPKPKPGASKPPAKSKTKSGQGAGPDISTPKKAADAEVQELWDLMKEARTELGKGSADLRNNWPSFSPVAEKAAADKALPLVRAIGKKFRERYLTRHAVADVADKAKAQLDTTRRNLDKWLKKNRGLSQEEIKRAGGTSMRPGGHLQFWDHPEYRRLEDLVNDARRANRLAKKGKKLDLSHLAEELAEVRNMGGKVKASGNKKIKPLTEAVKAEGQKMPADWVKTVSNQKISLKKRGSHNKGTNSLKVGNKQQGGWKWDAASVEERALMAAKNKATILHEFMHANQTTRVDAMERAFVRSRLEKYKGTPKGELSPIHPGSSEVGYEDGFRNKYMGRQYPWENSAGTEIMTTGMEGLFFDEYQLWSRSNGDSDMLDFVLGVLLSM